MLRCCRIKDRDAVVKQLGDRFKAQPAEIVDRVTALQDELKAIGKALAAAPACRGRLRAWWNSSASRRQL